MAGKTASSTLRQSDTGRSDADHSFHVAHHALLARTGILARQTQDPRSRLCARRHSRRDNDRVGRQTKAPPRYGRNDRFGRRAVDNRASIYCHLLDETDFFFSVVFSRGRTGSMVHRRCTDWWTRLSHGGDWFVDQRRTRVIRPTRCVHHIPPILSYHSPSYHSFLFLFSKTKTLSPGFRSILGLESWAPE